jgi:hypothetical protein
LPDFLTSFFKEKSPAFFAVSALFSGFLLFLPEDSLQRLGLDTFINENKNWLGAAFLFSICFLAVWAVQKAYKFIQGKLRNKWANEAWKKEHHGYIDRLTEMEMQYIILFLGGIAKLTFREEDGIRGSLVAKGIIYRSANVGNMIDGFDYNIQPWALDCLRENPKEYEKYFGPINTPEDYERIFNGKFPWKRDRFW